MTTGADQQWSKTKAAAAAAVPSWSFDVRRNLRGVSSDLTPMEIYTIWRIIKWKKNGHPIRFTTYLLNILL